MNDKILLEALLFNLKDNVLVGKCIHV